MPIAYVIHILKPIDRTVNLGYLESIFEHPTRRHIFANTVGLACKPYLTLRHMKMLQIKLRFEQKVTFQRI